jgi:hypothetical protein
VSRVVWDATGQRFYETGVDRAVLYVADNPGVAWNGVVSIDEKPSGGGPNPYYIDGIKYLNRPSREEFEFTIEAFYSPEEFDVCDGVGAYLVGVFVSQQRRQPFALAYRTAIGNDVEGQAYGYKLHLIYNALVAPADNKHATETDSLTVTSLSWDATTTPIQVPGFMRSAHIVVNSTLVPAFALASLEDIIYGTDDTDPRMPTPAEIAELFTDSSPFTVTDSGDHETFTITGSELAVHEGPTDTFTLSSEGVTIISGGTVELTST